MRLSMQEVINWCHQNPEELVIMYLSHFEGDIDGCQDAAVELMKSLGNFKHLNQENLCNFI